MVVGSIPTGPTSNQRVLRMFRLLPITDVMHLAATLGGSRRLPGAALQASALFAVSGFLACLLGAVGAPAHLRLGLLIGIGDLAVAAVIAVLPWRRWRTSATVWLSIPALALIGLSSAAGLLPIRTIGLFFALAFAWVGVNHPPLTGIKLLPATAIAYAAPLMIVHAKPPVDAGAVVLVVVVCALVSETISRGNDRIHHYERQLRASVDELRLLADNATDLITLVGPDGVVRYVSPSVQSVLGWRVDQLVGQPAARFCHPDDVSVEVATSRAKPGEQVVSTRRLLKADGSYVRVESTAQVVVNADGGREVRSSARDISERLRAESALARSEAEYRAAFDNAPVPMGHIGSDGRYTKVNRALCRLTRYPESELIGLPAMMLVHPDDREDALRSIQSGAAGQLPTLRAERRLITSDGRVLWVDVSGISIAGETGGVDHLLVHYLDISDTKKTEAQLRHEAEHDPMTDMLNRRGFSLELRNHLARIEREGPAGALLLLDIDHFKRVNDTLGHASGDCVIEGTADVLRRRLQGSDVVARLGGDEFAVLLPSATPDQADSVAQALVQAVRENVVLLPDGQPVSLTSSIGVAPFTTGLLAAEALGRADLALYAAKNAGRDQHALFDPSFIGSADLPGRLN